jgi:parvulin-like peptidyl-prolyl isomerase
MKLWDLPLLSFTRVWRPDLSRADAFSMTRMRLSFVAVILVAVLVAAGCGSKGSSSSSTGGGGVPTDAVATVAGKTITRAELDDLMKTAEISNQSSFPKPGTLEYQKLQQQAAVYLVTQEEYEQQATALGVKVTTVDVETALTALIKARWKGDRSQFDAYLKKTGLTLAQFNSDLRRQVLGEHLTKAVTKGVKVTPAEVKSFYEKNKGAPPYTTPAERRVRHILVALNAKGKGVSDKGVTETKIDFAKSKALADKLYAQLKAGGNFVSLVKKYSQDPGSKAKGGEYTDVKGTFVKEFETSAFSLKTNEISKPVKSQFGYHLIQALAATKPGKTQTFAAAQKGIRTTLLQQKQQAALQQWAAGLGKKYKGKVKYASGFEPPAPSTTTTSQ